jgi:hypothetical protein
MAAVTSIITQPDGTFSGLAMGTGGHTLFEKRIQTTPRLQPQCNSAAAQTPPVPIMTY